MKYMIWAGWVATLFVTARAETPATNAAPAATHAAVAAKSEPVSSPAAMKAWDKLTADFQTLQKLESPDAAAAQKAITSLFAETKDFTTKFPDDAHALNATMVWAQLGQVMIAKGYPGAPAEAEITGTFDRLASDEKVPKQKRAEIRLMQINEMMRGAADTPGDAAKWDAIDAKFDSFGKEFGDDFTFDGQNSPVAQLRGQELEILASAPDHARADALTKKLSASTQPQLAAVGKAVADRAQRAADLKSKPLDLKYTAVDGTAVDLSKMRGKVVLVDFWATWCGPCVGEVPNVVAAYKKYHDKGFEVAGVSLDQDKDAMLAFTKSHDMAWPQYFDGKGWQNAVSTGYGINSIPAMWLVGKDGILITTDAREDLAGQVEKALAAK